MPPKFKVVPSPELLPLAVALFHGPHWAAASWADVYLLAYLSARLEPPPQQRLVLDITAPLWLAPQEFHGKAIQYMVFE